MNLETNNKSPKNFEQTKNSQLTVKHRWNQSKYAISEESDEPNSRYQPKTHFGPNLGLNGPILGPNIFFKHNKH